MNATLSLVQDAPRTYSLNVLDAQFWANLKKLNEVERLLRTHGFKVDARDIEQCRLHLLYDAQKQSLGAIKRIASSYRWVPVAGKAGHYVGFAMLGDVMLEWKSNP